MKRRVLRAIPIFWALMVTATLYMVGNGHNLVLLAVCAFIGFGVWSGLRLLVDAALKDDK